MPDEPTRTEMPIPISGRSKYRDLAQHIIDAYLRGHAVSVTEDEYDHRSSIKTQVEILLYARFGRHVRVRLHSQLGESSYWLWLQSFDPALLALAGQQGGEDA